MAFTLGTHLGPYEILSALGAGGMGEVYRGRDTKLNRTVAMKILPEAFTRDPDRLARFKREAQILASLNHPNIGAIYGFEESDGVQALVLELVEGRTLADAIAKGPIALDEALRIARQIAEALEAAHEHGVIHRDLKPANIKVREDATVKVLDFGLAKAYQLERVPGIDPSLSPTITSPAMTGMGVILGTAAYMSPEQARGKTVDKRSDIWAFGCVLYEMLTGRRAFVGEDVSETLAAVIKGEPDWSVLPADIPTAVRRLLRRCLQKDANERLHDISDARIELRDAQAEASTGAVLPVASRRSRERLAWMAVALVLAVALAVSLVLIRLPTPAAPEMRLEITTPATASPLHFALSPDGARLVFVASGEGQPRLWVRALDAVAAHPLAGTEDAQFPFWSPDSRSIGFFAGGQLKRIDIAGGPPQALAVVAAPRGGTWNPDGTILFAASNGGPLFRVSARGGEPSGVTRIGSGQASHRFPQILPDGRHFLFFVEGSAGSGGIHLGSLDGEESRPLVASESTGAWVPPGWMLFVRQGALVATPFDAGRGEITGEAITLADPVSFEPSLNHGGFSVSAAGLVAYRAGGPTLRQLTWYDRDGKVAGTEPSENAPSYPELSPDARRVALHRTVQNNVDVWLIDLMRNGSTRFTFDAATDGFPLWSPDGTRIAFASNRNGVMDLYLKPSSGAGTEELVRESPSAKLPLSWSSDGRFLLFVEAGPTKTADLWTQPLTGDGKPSPWLNTPFAETGGQFSPDGRWVAYQSNESGSFEIYVQPFPAPSAKWQISTRGGTMPRWRADGKELFFIAPDATLMAARVTASDRTFEAAPPIALFETRIQGGPNQIFKHQYAVSRDGRFLITEPAEESVPTPITLILNWQPRP